MGIVEEWAGPARSGDSACVECRHVRHEHLEPAHWLCAATPAGSARDPLRGGPVLTPCSRVNVDGRCAKWRLGRVKALALALICAAAGYVMALLLLAGIAHGSIETGAYPSGQPRRLPNDGPCPVRPTPVAAPEPTPAQDVYGAGG